MKTRTQAFLDWFHGRTNKPMPTPETDVGEAFNAGWDAREDAAVRAQDVKNDVGAPDVVHWVESVTLQLRVSLPAHDYDELRAENERLKTEITERQEMWRVTSETAQQYAAEIERLRKIIDEITSEDDE